MNDSMTSTLPDADMRGALEALLFLTQKIGPESCNNQGKNIDEKELEKELEKRACKSEKQSRGW